MGNYIEVNYKTYSTVLNALEALKDLPYVLGLDFETQSLYSNAERAEAKELLKEEDKLDRPTERLCKLVANSSGLSFPSITKITHMNIGISEKEAIVIVIDNAYMEKTILNWLVTSNHHFVIHNSGFDLKQVYVKTGKLPKHYDDTQLLTKSFINNADTWKANTGLKILMGQYYKPSWSLVKEDYNNEDLKKESFLEYCTIDACACWLLWHQLQEEIELKKEE